MSVETLDVLLREFFSIEEFLQEVPIGPSSADLTVHMVVLRKMLDIITVVYGTDLTSWFVTAICAMVCRWGRNEARIALPG